MLVISYIVASVLFILSLGGLSNPESSRRGNWFGIIGMAIAVIATFFHPSVTSQGYAPLIAMVVIGGAIGSVVAALRAKNMDVLVIDDGSSDGTAEAAEKAGADIVTLCETNGGTLFREVSAICKTVSSAA